MKFRYDNSALDYNDILMVPKPTPVSSRSEVDLTVKYSYDFCDWEGIPIMAANMNGIGTFKTASVLSEFKMMTALHKSYNLDDFKREKYDPKYIAVSCGFSNVEETREILRYNPEIRFVVLDVANGYMEDFLDLCSYFKGNHSNIVLVAGNVCTREGTQRLFVRGVDIAKIGIGPGSVCLTRQKTGIGIPQVTAVDECKTTYYKGKQIIADGGCTCPGDVAKAFAIGANWVMLGGMFAGHEETTTNFYGMASRDASLPEDYKTYEGKSVVVPERGYLKDTIRDILGGLRSSCSYLGFYKLTEMIGDPGIEFVKVNRQLNGVFDAK